MLSTHLINTPLFPLCRVASIRHFSSCTARPNINHTLICDFYLMQIAPLGKALEHHEGGQHSAYTHPAWPNPDVVRPSRMRLFVYEVPLHLSVVYHFKLHDIAHTGGIIPNQDLLKWSRK